MESKSLLKVFFVAVLFAIIVFGVFFFLGQKDDLPPSVITPESKQFGDDGSLVGGSSVLIDGSSSLGETISGDDGIVVIDEIDSSPVLGDGSFLSEDSEFSNSDLFAELFPKQTSIPDLLSHSSSIRNNAFPINQTPFEFVNFNTRDESSVSTEDISPEDGEDVSPEDGVDVQDRAQRLFDLRERTAERLAGSKRSKGRNALQAVRNIVGSVLISCGIDALISGIASYLSFSVTTSDIPTIVKECFKDTTITILKDKFLARLFNQYIAYAATGFGGKPLLSSNPEKFWDDVEKDATGVAIEKAGLAGLCGIGFDWRAQLNLNFKQFQIEEASCTIQGIKDAVVSFDEDIEETLDFYKSGEFLDVNFIARKLGRSPGDRGIPPTVAYLQQLNEITRKRAAINPTRGLRDILEDGSGNLSAIENQDCLIGSRNPSDPTYGDGCKILFTHGQGDLAREKALDAQLSKLTEADEFGELTSAVASATLNGLTIALFNKFKGDDNSTDSKTTTPYTGTVGSPIINAFFSRVEFNSSSNSISSPGTLYNDVLWDEQIIEDYEDIKLAFKGLADTAWDTDVSTESKIEYIFGKSSHLVGRGDEVDDIENDGFEYIPVVFELTPTDAGLFLGKYLTNNNETFSETYETLRDILKKRNLPNSNAIYECTKEGSEQYQSGTRCPRNYSRRGECQVDEVPDYRPRAICTSASLITEKGEERQGIKYYGDGDIGVVVDSFEGRADSIVEEYSDFIKAAKTIYQDTLDHARTEEVKTEASTIAYVKGLQNASLWVRKGNFEDVEILLSGVDVPGGKPSPSSIDFREAAAYQGLEKEVAEILKVTETKWEDIRSVADINFIQSGNSGILTSLYRLDIGLLPERCNATAEEGEWVRLGGVADVEVGERLIRCTINDLDVLVDRLIYQAPITEDDIELLVFTYAWFAKRVNQIDHIINAFENNEGGLNFFLRVGTSGDPRSGYENPLNEFLSLEEEERDRRKDGITPVVFSRFYRRVFGERVSEKILEIRVEL